MSPGVTASGSEGPASDPATLALFVLRVRVFAEADEIAPRCGLDRDELSVVLDDLADDGLILYRETASRSGWRLTRQGRTEGARRWRTEAVDAGVLPQVEADYHRFRELNQPFLAVCTDWQVADLDAGRINDHTDPARDAAVLDDLQALDAEIASVCERLSAALQRYGWYRPRFSSALARARAGEVEAVAAPLPDSYHTLWFELHEDLLVTLDLDRASERTSERVSS